MGIETITIQHPKFISVADIIVHLRALLSSLLCSCSALLNSKKCLFCVSKTMSKGKGIDVANCLDLLLAQLLALVMMKTCKLKI